MIDSEESPKSVGSLAGSSPGSDRSYARPRFLPAIPSPSRPGRRSLELQHRGGPRSCDCWCHRDLLTIPEAAAYLRIGRSKAYELANRFRVTNGTEGMPVIGIGDHTLRVPMTQLRRWCALDEAPPLHCGQCSSSDDLLPPA